MAREAWDVVVVGGGPAGSAVAARMADAGWAVLVLDRARFPRRKPCGECVNPAGVEALRSLGVWDRVESLHPARLDGWRIDAGAGRGFTGSFPAAANGIGIPRAVLDDLLLRHAIDRGAVVRTDARVTDVVRDDDGRVAGVRVMDDEGGDRMIRARLVVGADGLRSVVVRRLGLVRRAPKLRKLALTAHVRGWTGAPGRGELHAVEGGCLGIADVGDGTANVTVVVYGDGGKTVGGDAAGYFDRALERYGLRGAERVDDVLATGPFDLPVRRAIVDGALLVGDAAGYYDPFTGQGIFRALRGAEIAAAAADSALRSGRATARTLLPYERERRRAFGPGERVQRVVEAFVSRPAWLGAVAGRFARRPALADAVIHVTGDVRPVRSLLRPALLAKLVV